jgi:hypothetical protein
MPPEGAPELLREQIEQGREAVIALLAQVIGHGAGERAGSPDPPLTARLASTVADEAARLTLTDPERYPEERLMDQARWLLGRLAADRPS